MLSALFWVPFLPIALAPLALRARAGAWLLGLAGAAGSLALLLPMLPEVATGHTLSLRLLWVPGLDVVYALRVDGLGLLFALLIALVGVLIVLYARAYLAGVPGQGAFFAALLLFMGAMLGVAVADSLVVLYLFWELTSLASFFLIGFHHENPAARRGALHALVVTVGGGLAMLGGVVLLGAAAGTVELSALAARGAQVRSHPAAAWALALLLAGAFTKSAQVPFHFWLPGAMVAPTPVSAYLHSATMVKAGVFLLLRLLPLFGETALWQAIVLPVGLATYFWGSVVAVGQDDLKALLAYGTVGALGLATALAGTGTASGRDAALLFLLAHAAYKGTLFLVAGAVEHETGTRSLGRLGGLATSMPLAAVAALLAVLSMVGVPAFAGYLAKGLAGQAFNGILSQAPSVGGVLTMAYGMRVLSVFWSSRPRIEPTPVSGSAAHPHDPPDLLLPAAVLALAGLFLGVWPPLLEGALRLLGGAYGLWHGVSLSTVATLAVTAAGGAVIARLLARPLPTRLQPLAGGEVLVRLLDGLLSGARALTALTMTGRLRDYLLVVLVTGFGAALPALRRGVWESPLVALHPHDAVLLVLAAAAILVTATVRSLLSTVIAVGATGYTVALLFLSLMAPDLALTQVLVETVTLVLLLTVVSHLTRADVPDRHPRAWLDLAVASVVGIATAAFALLVLHGPPARHLEAFFAAKAPEAGGANLVNLILVDFRGLDTLGEITVLAIAALGVVALAQQAHSLSRLRQGTSILLQTVTRVAAPAIVLYALYLLATGHYGPGGGFVAGLMTATALILWGLAFGLEVVARNWRAGLAAGLILAGGTGVGGLLLGHPFLTHGTLELGGVKVASSLLFEVGVYILVTSATMAAVQTIAEIGPPP